MTSNRVPKLLRFNEFVACFTQSSWSPETSTQLTAMPGAAALLGAAAAETNRSPAKKVRSPIMVLPTCVEVQKVPVNRIADNRVTAGPTANGAPRPVIRVSFGELTLRPRHRLVRSLD